MKLFFTLLGLLMLTSVGRAQTSETHNFTTYDTTISIIPCTYCTADKWNVRISRPTNMFKAGDPDTASRPAIIMMPGQGEQGTTDVSKLVVYGPHYWLNNGWDGGVTLSNGKHYPILITVSYINNYYPAAPAYYNLLVYLLKTYHIKRNSVHVTGLSQGAFTNGALIEFEQTAGDEAGMKLVTTLTALEGTPDPLPSPFSTWSRGFTAYKVWAKKYGGRYFYLEGSGTDNFRDGWQYADAMNDSVPGSAYFSYEDLGGGAHCCWNSMYDPGATNWTCAPATALGPNNAPSQAGTNQMGDYKAPSSIFQWMMQHGDTSIVGSTTTTTTTLTPVANAGSDQTITLPTSSVTLTGTGTETGGTIKSYAWTQVSGPSTAAIGTATTAQTTVSSLVAGTYVFQLKVTDANGTSASDQVSVIVNAAPIPVANAGSDQTIILPTSSVTLTGTGTETGGTIKSYAWSQVSGPSTATIGTATTAQTTVSSLVAGTYVFQLKVTDANGATATDQVNVVVNAATSSSATTTTYQSVPGTIQAESYASMSGVATETTTDAGGGLDVGWISAGDQMSYNINAASAGTYTVSFRVSSALTSPSFKLQDAKGNILATVNVPTTGGWQVWTTVTASITLPAGQQTLTIVSLSANGWNLNWMQFALQTAAAATVTSGKVIPGTIQAEDYDAVIGANTETTSDTGGGKDVNYLNYPGNQVSYNVTVTAAATYTASFRVASPVTGATFKVMNGTGTVLATVTVPNTGGWQIWSTVNASIPLAAGAQTIKVVCQSTSGFNFNWMQFATQTTTAATVSRQATVSSFTLDQSTDPALSAAPDHITVYPNPAGDQINLEISNSVTGAISVKVINAMGVTVRSYQYSKDAPLLQRSISLSGLTTGLYFIRIQGSGWSETKKILKK